jgi:hypothetical protein
MVEGRPERAGVRRASKQVQLRREGRKGEMIAE